MSKLITPGDPAPDFELEDVHGKPVRLSDLRGKPVILAFLRGFQ
jgi:peroxiredoxin